MERKSHWETVYDTKASTAVSWYQPVPTRSLEIMRTLGVGRDTAVIDVGGGDSLLVDALIDFGVEAVTVLDISQAALRRAQARLGDRARAVHWIDDDVTSATLPSDAFDIWHDRAVFHFLTSAADRRKYVNTATEAVRRGGHAIIATFAIDGPVRCSGLEVVRYSPDGIAAEFGDAFALRTGFGDVHVTPTGAEQQFSWAVLQHL